MPADPSMPILKQLTLLHSHSLAQYLHYALPWSEAGRDRDVLVQIAEAHEATADRFRQLIQQRRGDLPRGEFSLHYSSLHDLSFAYLLPMLIRHQQADIQALQRSLPRLARDAAALALAEESLGEAIGHLDSLQDLAQPTSAA